MKKLLLLTILSLSFAVFIGGNDKTINIGNTPSVNIDNSITLSEDTAITINQILNSPDVKALIYGAISTDNWQQIVVDSATHALVTIDDEYHKIHIGNHFFICGFETLAENASITFSITVSDTNIWPHMNFAIEGTTQTEMYVYEDIAFTGGTTVTPNNNNRNSTKVSTMTIKKSPIVSDIGTLLYSQSKGLAGATPAKASNGGFIKNNSKIILKQNSTTLFVIKSKDDDNIVSYCSEWYELANKN